MKIFKIILIISAILAFFIFFGDILKLFIEQDPKEILLNKAEIELKNSMNNPNSYEFVSFEEDFIYSANYRKDDAIFAIEMKSHLYNDYYLLQYRGSNKIGAKIIDEVLVKTLEGTFIEIIDIK